IRVAPCPRSRRLQRRPILGALLGSVLGRGVLPGAGLLPGARGRLAARAGAVCRAQRPAAGLGLLVLLRCRARLLPVRQRMPERLESRAANTCAGPMKRSVIALAAVTLFAGCATPPPDGPSVMVLPGSNKSFDQFR